MDKYWHNVQLVSFDVIWLWIIIGLLFYLIINDISLLTKKRSVHRFHCTLAALQG